MLRSRVDCLYLYYAEEIFGNVMKGDGEEMNRGIYMACQQNTLICRTACTYYTIARRLILSSPIQRECCQQ